MAAPVQQRSRELDTSSWGMYDGKGSSQTSGEVAASLQEPKIQICHPRYRRYARRSAELDTSSWDTGSVKTFGRGYYVNKQPNCTIAVAGNRYVVLEHAQRWEVVTTSWQGGTRIRGAVLIERRLAELDMSSWSIHEHHGQGDTLTTLLQRIYKYGLETWLIRAAYLVNVTALRAAPSPPTTRHYTHGQVKAFPGSPNIKLEYLLMRDCHQWLQ
ncbi:hypothetical protein B0H34DRAFT_680209 [Crassisporium funariophilum]|nr:hypothetical protein B0H34DRAFT_680209 [Crassisporium funariophilum]